MKEKTKYLVEVGEHIRESRTKAGISQERLADLIGVTNITIHRVENGVYAIGIDTFFALAEALNVPLLELCPERFACNKRRKGLSNLEFQFMRLNDENKKVVYETAMTLINVLNMKQREMR